MPKLDQCRHCLFAKAVAGGGGRGHLPPPPLRIQGGNAPPPDIGGKKCSQFDKKCSEFNQSYEPLIQVVLKELRYL